MSGMTQILERGLFHFHEFEVMFEFIFLQYLYTFLQAVQVGAIIFYASSSQDLEIGETDSAAHLHMDVYPRSSKHM